MKLAPRISLLYCLIAFIPAAAPAAEPAAEWFRIHVRDEETGRGVPLVQLKTVHQASYWTDSAGMAAICEPGLWGQTVYFHVGSDGYRLPADGFGFRGVRVKLRPGGSFEIKLKRENIARRLYRLTGEGIYRDSVLLGDDPKHHQPLLNGRVLGSDSVMNVLYQGKLYWFWGDTNRPDYPLGNFHTPGATSDWNRENPPDAAQGIQLNYFLGQDGFAKPTCSMPGKGPTWLEGLIVLEEKGEQQMLASYAKIDPPLDVYQRGIVRWNDKEQQFQQQFTFEKEAPLYPQGHPFMHRENGEDYVYFTKILPHIRTRATPSAYLDLGKYEAYTCFTQGSSADRYALDRDKAGKLNWAWKRHTLPLTPELEDRLVRGGKLAENERAFRLTTAAGEQVKLHHGSVFYNEYRRRFVLIVCEIGGSSMLGEIWYAEAKRPEGPWENPRKIVTHENYSFYNPKQHPLFAQQGGRILYFEGTYTHTFSGNSSPTPRYDYNQIMYQLDLADPRLKLPQLAE